MVVIFLSEYKMVFLELVIAQFPVHLLSLIPMISMLYFFISLSICAALPQGSESILTIAGARWVRARGVHTPVGLQSAPLGSFLLRDPLQISPEVAKL